MGNRHAAVLKAWITRKAHMSGGQSAALQRLEAQMTKQRAGVVRRHVKGSDTLRARKLAADMLRSFRALKIQARPWMRGIKALAHGKGMKDYDMERRTGLPRANTWHPVRPMSAAQRARLHAAEAQIRRH